MTDFLENFDNSRNNEQAQNNQGGTQDRNIDKKDQTTEPKPDISTEQDAPQNTYATGPIEAKFPSSDNNAIATTEQPIENIEKSSLEQNRSMGEEDTMQHDVVHDSLGIDEGAIEKSKEEENVPFEQTAKIEQPATTISPVAEPERTEELKPAESEKKEEVSEEKRTKTDTEKPSSPKSPEKIQTKHIPSKKTASKSPEKTETSAAKHGKTKPTEDIEMKEETHDADDVHEKEKDKKKKKTEKTTKKQKATKTKGKGEEEEVVPAVSTRRSKKVDQQTVEKYEDLLNKKTKRAKKTKS